MSDCEGHGQKAVVYKSHFPATKALQWHSFSQRHHCIHRPINHVYYKGQALSYSLPHDNNDSIQFEIASLPFSLLPLLRLFHLKFVLKNVDICEFSSQIIGHTSSSFKRFRLQTDFPVLEKDDERTIMN